MTTEAVPLDELGSHVRDGFTTEHIPWLFELVKGLENDGLARVAECRALRSQPCQHARHPALKPAAPIR
ncbi:MAG: hypothetical protein R2839_02270 [Thermomicrobiales bacterium]